MGSGSSLQASLEHGRVTLAHYASSRTLENLAPSASSLTAAGRPFENTAMRLQQQPRCSQIVDAGVERLAGGVTADRQRQTGPHHAALMVGNIDVAIDNNFTRVIGAGGGGGDSS